VGFLLPTLAEGQTLGHRPGGGGEQQPHHHQQGHSVADPGSGISGAFLTPGSGIRNRFFFGIPDLGSQTYIFESLMTIFGVESSIILCKLAQIFFFFSLKLN
jgi:hypothetical protein